MQRSTWPPSAFLRHRALYTNLIHQDTAFFDLHTPKEIEYLSTIAEDLHEADEKLHRLVRHFVRAVCKTWHLWRLDRRCCAGGHGGERLPIRPPAAGREVGGHSPRAPEGVR